MLYRTILKCPTILLRDNLGHPKVGDSFFANVFIIELLTDWRKIATLIINQNGNHRNGYKNPPD